LVLIVSPLYTQAVNISKRDEAMKRMIQSRSKLFVNQPQNSGVDQYKWILNGLYDGSIQGAAKLQRNSQSQTVDEILNQLTGTSMVVVITSTHKVTPMTSSFKVHPGKHMGIVKSCEKHLNGLSNSYLSARNNAPFPTITIGTHHSEKAFIVFDEASHSLLLPQSFVSQLPTGEKAQALEQLSARWFNQVQTLLQNYRRESHGSLAKYLIKHVEQTFPSFAVEGGNGTSVWYCLACVIALSYALPIAWNYAGFHIFETLCEKLHFGDEGTCGMDAIEFLLVTGVGLLPLFAYEIFNVCGFHNPQNCKNNGK